MSEFKPKVWMTCPLCNKPSPFPDPDYREWVGLTVDEIAELVCNLEDPENRIELGQKIQDKLKERNT
jgi:hypothetical protein